VSLFSLLLVSGPPFSVFLPFRFPFLRPELHFIYLFGKVRLTKRAKNRDKKRNRKTVNKTTNEMFNLVSFRPPEKDEANLQFARFSDGLVRLWSKANLTRAGGGIIHGWRSTKSSSLQASSKL
jgi:hypothetical protein